MKVNYEIDEEMFVFEPKVAIEECDRSSDTKLTFVWYCNCVCFLRK